MPQDSLSQALDAISSASAPRAAPPRRGPGSLSHALDDPAAPTTPQVNAEGIQRLYNSEGKPKGQTFAEFSKKIGYTPPPEESFGTKVAHALETAGRETLGAADAFQGVVTGDVKNVLQTVEEPVLKMEQALVGSETPIPPIPFPKFMGHGFTKTGERDIRTALPWVSGQAEHDAVLSATGDKTLAELARLGTMAAPILLTDSPVTRGMTRYISDPIKRTASDTAIGTMEKSEIGRSWIASHRIEDRLYQVQGAEQAARIEANTLVKSVNDMDLTPEDRTALADYQQDPTQTYPLTDKQKAAYAVLAPAIKNLGWEPGYMHRVTAITSRGAGRLLAPADQDFIGNEFAGKLSESAAQPREYFKATYTAPDGTKTEAVAHVRHYVGMPGRTVTGYKDHQSFEMGTIPAEGEAVEHSVTDPLGREWKIGDASIKDIEANANTLYHHDLSLSVHQAMVQRARVNAWNTALDDIKTNPAYYHLVQPEEAVPRHGWGRINVPEFRGYTAPHRVAKTLEAAMNGPELWKGARWLNNLMFRVNFATGPFWHLFNVGSIATAEGAGRGFNFARPFGLIGETGRAFNQVVTGGDDYLKLLRDGFPFMHSRVVEPKITRSLLSSIIREVDGPYMRQAAKEGIIDPKFLKFIGDGLKGRVLRGKQVMGNVMEAWESQPTWIGNDAMLLRAVYARMDHTGDDLLTAGRKVAPHFPGYRMRMSRPGLDDALHMAQQSGLVWFMPYHMDVLRIMGGRLRDAATLDPEALRTLAAQAVIYSVLYPRIDEAVQKRYGAKAHIERFGDEKVLQAIDDVRNHKVGVAHLVHLFLTPSVEGAVAQYLFDPPYPEKRKTVAQQSADIAAYAAGSFYPLQNVNLQKSAKENLDDVLASQLGVEGIPK